jgi:hypothetical protein
MGYMETRPGKRKPLQRLAPQRASGVRGRRIKTSHWEYNWFRDLTGPHHALHLPNKDAGLQSAIEALLPILGVAHQKWRQTRRHPQRA